MASHAWSRLEGCGKRRALKFKDVAREEHSNSMLFPLSTLRITRLHGWARIEDEQNLECQSLYMSRLYNNLWINRPDSCQWPPWDVQMPNASRSLSNQLSNGQFQNCGLELDTKYNSLVNLEYWCEPEHERKAFWGTTCLPLYNVQTTTN